MGSRGRPLNNTTAFPNPGLPETVAAFRKMTRAFEKTLDTIGRELDKAMRGLTLRWTVLAMMPRLELAEVMVGGFVPYGLEPTWPQKQTPAVEGGGDPRARGAPAKVTPCLLPAPE